MVTQVGSRVLGDWIKKKKPQEGGFLTWWHLWPVPTRLFRLNVICCLPPTDQEDRRLCDSQTVLVHSRAILQDVLDADLSNEAFPFSTHQLVRAAGHLVGSTRPLGAGMC